MPTFRSVRIAVTLGDPAGIGPEVALKALYALRGDASARFVLLGPASFYSSLARSLRLPLRFHDSCWCETAFLRGSIPCFSTGKLPRSFLRGRSDTRLTALAVRSIETAVALATEGAVDAIVTPPINKAGLKKAGFDIPGHTEYLAKLSKTKKFEMMLVGGGLRVVLVTRHVAIKDVSAGLTKKRIQEAITLTERELRLSFGIKRPRLAVAGLNPHAGEEGHIGKEEIRTIAPAVRAAKQRIRGVVDGPIPPDVLFYQAYTGKYDAEICMYHDQGLIPLKMISRGGGVNVTIGLPFVRTSPDHGTAYDIAPKFCADAGSMTEALRLAVELARNRKRHA
jgi:4-hydroxythreonine-4-phosphate dehydrogenase